MYGKLFASTFTGSMYGAGADVFAVWAYVVANTRDSQVELNPVMLAGMLGASPERVEAALDYLSAPDTHSRSKVAEGRRLIREGEFTYRVPNYETYRGIRNEDERRAYNRQKKADQREREAKVKARVNDSQHVSAQAEAEAEAEAVQPVAPRPVKAPTRPDTWLTPYLTVWNAAGGSVSPGKLAKALHALHDEIGPNRLAGALRAYLAEGRAKYGPHLFVESWREWDAKAFGAHLSDRERQSLAAMQDFAREGP